MLRHIACIALSLLVAPAEGFFVAGLAVPRAVAPRRDHSAIVMSSEQPLFIPQRETFGCDGQRAVILIFVNDQANRVQSALKLFEASSDDYSRRGCKLVALRSRPDPRSESRYPSFSFQEGLEEKAELRAALGLEDLQPVFYGPRAYLVEPNGNVCQMSEGVRMDAIWTEITQALHAMTEDPGAPKERSAEEVLAEFEADQAQRVQAYKEGADWARVLEEDESLRQPTRWWLDGIGDGPSGGPKYLSASERKMLPEAGVPRLSSKDGVQAPEWYALAKQRAEAKQSAQVRSSSSGSGQGGQGASSNDQPASGYPFGMDPRKSSPAAAFLDGLMGKNPAGGATPPPPPPDAAQAAQAAYTLPSDSTMERANLLALGLSRSAPTADSRRRLRLLRELEETVAEIEAEGCPPDAEILQPLKARIAAAWGSAPPEAIAKRQAEEAAAVRAEENGGRFTYEDFVEVLSDAVPDVELDLAKWRLTVV